MFYKLSTIPNFKKELSYFEILGIKQYLKEFFDNPEDLFGLPYISSGKFAELSNTNSPYEIEPGIKLEYFALTENKILVAVGWDSEENEYYYRVEE